MPIILQVLNSNKEWIGIAKVFTGCVALLPNILLLAHINLHL